MKNRLANFIGLFTLLIISNPYVFSQNPNEYAANNIYSQLAHFEWLPAIPGGKSGMFSSYDRSGGNIDWIGNLGNAGDGSKIIAHMDGPGCITRIWMTNACYSDGYDFQDDTILKIYLNGESDPVINVPLKIFFGNYAHFELPLAHKVKKAYFSYVPIPYTQSCEITLEEGSTTAIYYQINYRQFLTNQGMDDFSLTLNTSNASNLDDFIDIWNNPGSTPYKISDLTEISVDKNCPPGEEINLFNIEGPGVITMMDIDVEDRGMLRNTYLSIYWDNNVNPAVNIPIADFFGMRFENRKYKSVPIGITEDKLYCYFPMPFSVNARITIKNTNYGNLQMRSNLKYKKMSEIDDRFGRFHAFYHEELPTEQYRHYQLLTINGTGKLVGVMLNMDNTGGTGAMIEGDEIIYVNGESQPSWHGTGSEDFFNQAWGYNDVIYPFHGTPYFYYPNYTYLKFTCYRFMPSDFVIFDGSINALFEVGHNSEVVANYSSVVYYYLLGEGIVLDTNPPSPPTGVKVNKGIE